MILPYHGSFFDLRYKYEDIFKDQIQKEKKMQKKMSKSPEKDSHKKIYKISYHINLLPSIGEYAILQQPNDQSGKSLI